MKKILLMAVLFAGQFLTAQIDKNLGDFTTVKAYDQIDVLLVKSDQNKISIKGSRAEDVEVVTKNNELKIRMKLTKLLQGEDVSVTVYYTQPINHVEASEGARIASQDTFKATSFELNAKEGAEIKLNLEVKKLVSVASSGGILNISGEAAAHDAVLKAGGILKSRELVTEQTAVTVNAGGEAEVYATELVDAKTRAGGDIDVYGNPKQVNKTNTIGGNINIKS